MEKLDFEIEDALSRLTALVEITRWVWAVNLAALIVALIYGSYQVAVLAAFTGLLTLVGAAIGRRASRYLNSAHDTVESGLADRADLRTESS